MAFDKNFIQELCDRNDIEDVVSQYVQLTKKSGNNKFGLCPFHSEKTPSFSVSTDKQIYHCFGCGKGGGVINFIMDIENLSFPDAVRFLAKRVGMEVPEDVRDENYSKRERMISLNTDAARFFYSQLISENGKAAQEYIKQRHIAPHMVTRFGLGFAPNTWNSLIDAMHKKGYSNLEMFDAGLVRASKKGNGYYDTFRNRLMFPVIDVRGNVIGFSGRILDDGEPKYMNSPETIVFNKSRNLFAMNLAKKSKKGYIILSEGNIDVASLHQAGIDCAVASLGTSLTPEQARLISRYTNEVVIAYDGDSAGQKASKRAITILEKLDMKVRVLKITGAKDPDEYIKKYGVASFENLLKDSENHIEYLLKNVQSKYDMSTEESRIEFLKDAVSVLAGIPSEIERDIYSRKVAQTAKVSSDAVLAEVKRLRKKKIGQAKKKKEWEITHPTRTSQPIDKELRFDNVRSAEAEKGIIRLLYYEPSLFGAKNITKIHFTSAVLKKFFDKLTELTEFESQPSVAMLAGKITSAEMALLTEIIQKPIEYANAEKELAGCLQIIENERILCMKEEADNNDLLRLRDLQLETKGHGGNKNG